MNREINTLLREASSRLSEDWEEVGSPAEVFLQGLSELIAKRAGLGEEEAWESLKGTIVEMIQKEFIPALPEDGDSKSQSAWVTDAHEAGILGYALSNAVKSTK